MPSAADAQIIQYNGTLVDAAINIHTNDPATSRTITEPDLSGTMSASFDDVANTFSGSATFDPYVAPNQPGPFGLTVRITIYLTQTNPLTGTVGGGGTTFTGSGTFRLALLVEGSNDPTDPAGWVEFANPSTCYVDVTMPITGTSNGTTTVGVTNSQFTIPTFAANSCGLATDDINNQLAGESNNAFFTYEGQATTTTTSTTTTSTTTTTPTTTTSTTQPTTTTNPNQSTTTTSTTQPATTTTQPATTTSTTQPATTTTYYEGTTTTVPGTTSTTGIPVTLLPTTTTAPAVTTTPTTAATTTTAAVTTTPSTEPSTVPETVPTTAPDTSATTAPSSETTVAGGDVSGNDASNGGTGSTAGSGLARTGSDTTGQAVLGGSLLAIGGVLVLSARRRRLGDA